MGGLDEVEEYVLLRPERVTSEVLPACLHAECTRAEPFISTIECRWKSRLVMPSCGSFQSIQARPWRGHFGSPRRGRLRCRRSVGSLSEICRRSGGSLSEICRKSVGNLSEVCRKSVGLSEACRRSVGNLSEVCRKSVGNLSEISDGVSNAIKTDAPTVGNLSETFRHTLTVGNLAEPVGIFLSGTFGSSHRIVPVRPQHCPYSQACCSASMVRPVGKTEDPACQAESCNVLHVI